MGMFDDISVSDAIDLPEPRPSTRNFQTKDLDCAMHRYRISDGGRLIQERLDDRGVTDHDEEFHGDLRFYTHEGSRANDDWKWFEFKARFTDGKLVRIEPVLEKKE